MVAHRGIEPLLPGREPGVLTARRMGHKRGGFDMRPAAKSLNEPETSLTEMVAPQGFEPRSTIPETVVLPLDDGAMQAGN